MAAINPAVSETAVIENLRALNLSGAKQANTESSLFLRLPAELRNQVYELVITRHFRLRGRRQSTYPSSHDSRSHPASRSTALALLSVNRQVYLETRLLPFQLNTIILPKFPYQLSRYDGRRFFLRRYTHVLEGLQEWLRREIRHLDLHLDAEDLNRLSKRDYHYAAYRGSEPRFGSQGQTGLGGLNLWVDLFHDDLEGLGHWIAGRLPMLPSLETLTVNQCVIVLSKGHGPQAG